MNQKTGQSYFWFILLTEAVGALSGWLTRNGMRTYESVPQSPLTPPSFIFPIVWAILFALMGIGAARVWQTPQSAARRRGLWLFGIQLFFNFCWSLVYFNLQAFGFAFFWLILLWLLILWMTLAFRDVDKPAALMQIPYLIWVAFAGYLNCTTWLLNR